jgi:hypothetical protein
MVFDPAALPLSRQTLTHVTGIMGVTAGGSALRDAGWAPGRSWPAPDAPGAPWSGLSRSAGTRDLDREGQDLPGAGPVG